jgi:hypothetical protein
MTGRQVSYPYRRHPILESCFAGHLTVAYEPRKSVAPERFTALMDKRQQPRSAPKDRCGVPIHLSEQFLDTGRGRHQIVGVETQIAVPPIQ